MANPFVEVNKLENSQVGESFPKTSLLRDNKPSYMFDMFVLGSGDHLGLNLTFDLLTRNNYMS